MMSPRIHARPRRPASVMSQDELRYWIREFLYNPIYGWSHCKGAFARCLAIDLHGLKSKIRQGRTQAWFRGGEQFRFSRQIRLLLSGRIVPKQIRAKSGQLRWEAVVADQPQPLPVHQPPRFRYNLAAGRLELMPPVKPIFPTLPSFRAAIEHIREAAEAQGADAGAEEDDPS
jgi:hypothetical protein